VPNLLAADDGLNVMVAYLYYLDTFDKIDGTWRVAERHLILDWGETPNLGTGVQSLRLRLASTA
jgi:hypothetical protein